MANEITISAVTGLTPTMQLYSGTVPVGPVINFTEITGTGVYVGSVPAGIPYGQYMGIALVNPNTVLASGQLWWDGAYELPVSLGMLAGIDPNNPMTAKATERKSGNIDLKVDGYGSPLTTVTRQ